MTLVNEYVPVVTWTEPEGIAVRGTLVVIPGRGEQPGHYERFGRRIAADGYRVHAVTDNGEIVLAARLLGTTAPANEAVAERARQAWRDGLAPGSLGDDDLTATLFPG
jgi:hypothetical protein